MIKEITIGSPSYNSEKALQLAKDWEQTDEKFMMITDEFCMSVNDARVDYWVDRIEDKLEKILKANKTKLDDNAQSWLWLYNQQK